jgi:hypothetical protein
MLHSSSKAQPANLLPDNPPVLEPKGGRRGENVRGRRQRENLSEMDYPPVEGRWQEEKPPGRHCCDPIRQSALAYWMLPPTRSLVGAAVLSN